MIGDFYSAVMDRFPVPREVAEMGSVVESTLSCEGVVGSVNPERRNAKHNRRNT